VVFSLWRLSEQKDVSERILTLLMKDLRMRWMWILTDRSGLIDNLSVVDQKEEGWQGREGREIGRRKRR